jgi:integrase/recombinase XerD
MGTDPSRVVMSGPLTPFAAGFAGGLAGRGHAPGVVAVHLRLMAHLSRWLEARALGPADLGPSAVGAFVAARRAAGCSSGRTAGSLAPLLGYLRAAGAAPVPQAAAAQGPVDVLLARYGAYLARERGLARATIERNAELVRPFLDGLVRDGQLDLGGLTAAEVGAFMVQRCRGRPAQAQRTATALRSFLAFAHADGLPAAGLASAVPATASWKLAGLPRALTGEQVAALLGSCDGASVVGRRDSAVLAVLSRLGLRAGEVARLRLDDIDWRRGEMTVRGKGGRSDRLPRGPRSRRCAGRRAGIRTRQNPCGRTWWFPSGGHLISLYPDKTLTCRSGTWGPSGSWPGGCDDHTRATGPEGL